MRTARPKPGQLLPRQTLGFVGWVLDSKSFLFREATSAIWRVPVDGTSPKKLFGEVDFSSVFDFAINPYTQQIAYTLAERASAGKNEVWMVETMPKRVKSNK